MVPSPSYIVGQDSVRIREGFRGSYIYLIFFCWTLFSVYLYSRYSTLGDSQAYLAGAYDDDTHALRTVVITRMAETVFAVVRVELLAHLAFAAFAATGVGYMIKQARVHGPYRWPLLAILLIPNFGVWAAVIGRESLFVGMLGFFLGAVLSYWRRPAFRQWLLALLCIGGMSFIRAPYGLGTALFFLMFLIYRSGPRVRLSMGVQAIFFAGVCGFALALVWPYLDGYITGDVLPKARGYFTTKSETTRTWVYIDTTANLLTSLWWSLPLALVGPTPGEVAARPLMFPFFLSGLVVLGSWLYSVGVAFRVQSSREGKILLLDWLPASLFILIAYVPFGIYNSGSAIRYASCFLLFLIFPSMLLSAMSAEAIYADSRTTET
ncbi:MAG TPA: hypothetical protein VJ484_07750 [Lysobacter sp.]|nr:hypothetical protein [Lysobacter sp.]